jgi:hypothetical protein
MHRVHSKVQGQQPECWRPRDLLHLVVSLLYLPGMQVACALQYRYLNNICDVSHCQTQLVRTHSQCGPVSTLDPKPGSGINATATYRWEAGRPWQHSLHAQLECYTHMLGPAPGQALH